MIHLIIPRLISNTQQPIPSHGLITFLNPWSYMVLRRNPKILEHFHGICIDGILLSTLFIFLGKRCQRLSFDMTSLAGIVLSNLEKNNQSVAIIGSKQEDNSAAILTLHEHYPNLRIIANRSGYFSSPVELDEYCRFTTDLAPDCVVVGMGTPLQEEFLIKLWNLGWRGNAYTCGGFLHQTAKRLHYYPAWIDRLHLRWAFRIFDEPKLIRRYFLEYPRFVVVFSADILKYYLRF